MIKMPVKKTFEIKTKLPFLTYVEFKPKEVGKDIANDIYNYLIENYPELKGKISVKENKIYIWDLTYMIEDEKAEELKGGCAMKLKEKYKMI